MFHKEGYPSILIASVLFAALWWISTAIAHPILQFIPTLIGASVLILVLQFFRNPKRDAAHDQQTIAAPADGKVVQIKRVSEDEFFKDERLLVSIFMSPLNE